MVKELIDIKLLKNQDVLKNKVLLYYYKKLLRILTRKISLQIKLKFTRKVHVQKFSNSMYKNQCFLEERIIVIDF